jgi:HTH-type transcriptional regulator / antitoxin HigA
MTTTEFRPDYAPCPGELVTEYLEMLGISARALARRCGRSAKLMSEILTGKATLEPETALQLERVLNVEATIWLQMEAAYRLLIARKEEQAQMAHAIAWARTFPMADLYKRKILARTRNDADTVQQLLRFFGVASVNACQEYATSLGVSYRHSPSFDSNRNALFTWLRMGEVEANQMSCADYDRTAFLAALRTIRGLTTKPIDEFLPAMTEACAEAGVVFLIVRPLSGMAVSGVSRWLGPRKALIQQTLRHMANDHFWFTFFHEAAHLLLHSRKNVFVDGGPSGGTNDTEEDEANRWAAEFLVPPRSMADFINQSEFNPQRVRRFAAEIGVAPGIVVGQLQQYGVIEYSRFNQLKGRYQWSGDE